MQLYSHPSALASSPNEAKFSKSIKRRRRIDRWFKRGGLLMIMISFVVLFSIVARLVYQGGGALWRHEIKLPVTFSEEMLKLPENPSDMDLRQSHTAAVWHYSLLKELSLEDANRVQKRLIYRLISSGAESDLTHLLVDNPDIIGKTEVVTLPLSSQADSFLKSWSSEHIEVRTYEEPLSVLLENNTVEVTLNQPLFAAHLPSKPSLDQGLTPVDAESEAVFLSFNGGMVKLSQMASNTVKGEVVVPFSSKIEPSVLSRVNHWEVVTLKTPQSKRSLKDNAFAVLYTLKQKGLIIKEFNSDFFTRADSRTPERVGILGAMIGSFLTLIVCFVCSFPIGVAAAIYLEEFSPDSRLKRLLEVNINNLAAIPAVIYGLLGVALFLSMMGLPRSAPLVGGMVLSLKTLPVIIISTRAALKSVPLSIRQAAWALGASPMQTVFHHVIPLALPGIMTGTILGLSLALGETAPLLMIGMVAFIVQVPDWFTDAATVLPVQIYLWSDSPEQGFIEKTAAAILVLLVFMVSMNAIAIFLRRKFERRW